MTKDTPIMADHRAIEAAARAIHETEGILLPWDAMDDDFRVKVICRARAKNAIATYLAAQPQETPEQKAVEWQPRIGEKVTVRQHDEMPVWAKDWLDEYFVVGMTAYDGDKPINIWLSETWPPARGDASDGFTLDKIAPLAAAPQKAMPDAEGLYDDTKPVHAALNDLIKDGYATDQQRRTARAALDALTAANSRADKAERERDEALAACAFKDKTNKALQDINVGETHLRAQLAKVEAETIERCATAITLKAREMGRQECCGNGMNCGDHEECCENPNLMISEDEACGVIRALISKPDQPDAGEK